jgi:hypothetical protein
MMEENATLVVFYFWMDFRYWSCVKNFNDILSSEQQKKCYSKHIFYRSEWQQLKINKNRLSIPSVWNS